MKAEVHGDIYKYTHMYTGLQRLTETDMSFYELMCLRGNMVLDPKLVYDGNS